MSLKSKKGFTLIELLVVIGVTGMIMVAIVGIMLQTFKAKTKLSWNEEIESNGTWIMTEIRKNIIDSSGENMVCGVVASDNIVMVNLKGNGETTTITCDEATGIASNSANLLKDTLRVSNCSNFVSCETVPLGGSEYRVTKVNLSFDLSPATVPTGSPDFVKRTFQTSVVLRN